MGEGRERAGYDDISALLDNLADDMPELPEPITPARMPPTPSRETTKRSLKTALRNAEAPDAASRSAESDSFSVEHVISKMNKTLALAGAAPMSFQLQTGLSPSKQATPGAAIDAMTDLVTRILLETTSLREEVEELEGRLRNEKRSTTRVETALNQLKRREIELLEQVERERIRTKQLEDMRLAENKRSKREIADVRVLLHKAVGRENQAMSETKSMRKEFGRMQDKLHNVLSEKSPNETQGLRGSRGSHARAPAKPAISVIKPLHDENVDAKQARIEQFLDTVAFGYEHRQRELQSENEQLRNQLYRFEYYLQDVYDSVTVGGEEARPSTTGEETATDFAARSPEEDLENSVKLTLNSLRETIDHIRSQAACPAAGIEPNLFTPNENSPSIHPRPCTPPTSTPKDQSLRFTSLATPNSTFSSAQGKFSE